MSNWENAPYWAICKTTDACGRTMYHNQIPEPDEVIEAWVHNIGGAMISQDTSVCPNWRNTLEMTILPKSETPLFMPDWSKAKDRDDWAIWMGYDWYFADNLDVRVFKGLPVVARP